MTTSTRTTVSPTSGLCAALLAASAHAGASSPPDEAAPQPVIDAWLDGRLETAYDLNPHLGAFVIDTEVENAVVTLAGILQSEIDRELAVQIAEGIEGVREVDDQLTVDASHRPATVRAADAERSFPQWIEDRTTTAQVKTNLLTNANTRKLTIEVDTRNAVVTLTGAVPTRKQKMLAEMIARNTTGISSVRNRLKVDRGLAMEPAAPERAPEPQRHAAI